MLKDPGAIVPKEYSAPNLGVLDSHVIVGQGF